VPPDWIIWLSIYWLGMYLIMLIWYDHQIKTGKKPKLDLLVAFMIFIVVGFIPLIGIISLFTKGTKS